MFTFVEAEAFYEAGQYVDSLETVTTANGTTALVKTVPDEALRVGLHVMVGGLSSIAGGGKFGSGFLAAGFGALADEIPATDEFGTNLVIHATAGGVGSILGGGKFANGAVTGAFGYLFNELQECAHYGRTCTQADIDSMRGVVRDPTSPWLEDAVGAGTTVVGTAEGVAAADALLTTNQVRTGLGSLFMLSKILTTTVEDDMNIVEEAASRAVVEIDTAELPEAGETQAPSKVSPPNGQGGNPPKYPPKTGP